MNPRKRSTGICALLWVLCLMWYGTAGSAAPGGKDLVVVPASGPLAGKQVYGQSYALLIGINEYAHLPKEKWLEFAGNDVAALKEVLTTQYGFPEGNVTVLLNAQATGEGIRRALASLVDKRKVRPEDRILIYFSGHGQTVKLGNGGEMGFLVPHDARVEMEDADNPAPYMLTCLPMRAVWDYLESSPAKHVLLLADACYSGLLARSRALTSISPEALAALAGRRAIQVVTAGRRGEVSYELSRFGHGAFTQKLLEELKAKATTPGVVFTATELYAWVKRGVAELSRGKQTPQMGDYDTEGDFLFITAGRKEPAAGEVRVNPKDGSEMVYVPSGEFPMGLDRASVDAAIRQLQIEERDRADTYLNIPGSYRVNVPGFWIYRNEVTFAQYARFLRETGRPAPRCSADDQPVFWPSGQPAPGRERQPVVCVPWADARAYAEWAGGRLPTEAEWEKAARGTDGRLYPWGGHWDATRCNTSERLAGVPLFSESANIAWFRAYVAKPSPVERGSLQPVGTYLAGASPYGCLDMAGNAWEWCSSLYDPYPYNAADGREDPLRPGKRVVRGGAWMGTARHALSPRRTAFPPEGAYGHIGFRCVVDPAGLAPQATAIAPAVTAAPTAAALPASAGTAGAQASRVDRAEMVLVPAGEVTLGTDKVRMDGYDRDAANAMPAHRVVLPAFYLDRREVTNAQYAAFLNATGGAIRDKAGYDLVNTDWLLLEKVRGKWRPKRGFERYPMVSATWFGAVAYAKWAGKRLPTEAEWERAARGDDARRFPWGNVFDRARCNTLERVVGSDEPGPAETDCARAGLSSPWYLKNVKDDLRPVGSCPTGASPFGCLDMAGNVGEWTSSLFRPYPYVPDDGREDPAAEGQRVIRGGGCVSHWGEVLAYARAVELPTRGSATCGFRCAASEANGAPQAMAATR